MTDHLELEATEIADTVETVRTPVPAPAPRPRPKAWHIAVLGVGVFVFAGALAFMLGASSDRDDAQVAHRRATHLLRDTRAARDEAITDYGNLLLEADDMVEPSEALLKLDESLLDLADQQVAEAHTLQGLGSDPAAPIDPYNESVARHNALVDLYNKKLDEFTQSVLGTAPVDA